MAEKDLMWAASEVMKRLPIWPPTERMHEMWRKKESAVLVLYPPSLVALALALDAALRLGRMGEEYDIMWESLMDMVSQATGFRPVFSGKE